MLGKKKKAYGFLLRLIGRALDSQNESVPYLYREKTKKFGIYVRDRGSRICKIQVNCIKRVGISYFHDFVFQHFPIW